MLYFLKVISKMNKKLIPTYQCESVFKINYEYLKGLNIKNLFFDLDNTLASPYVSYPSLDVEKLFNSLKQKGFNIYIISNNHQNRVSLFTFSLKVNYFYELKKPKIKRIANIIKENNINLNESAFIGDQVMTDVLMANRLNACSILVSPLTKRDQLITFFPRLLDKHYRKIINKKNLAKEI